MNYRDSNDVAIRMMWDSEQCFKQYVTYEEYHKIMTEKINTFNHQGVLPDKKGFMEKLSICVSKLNVMDFKTKIDSFITMFGLSTFCYLFNHVIGIEENRLFDECSNNLCDNIYTIMESDDMLKIIDGSTIFYILARDKLNLDEETLFEFLAAWMKVNNMTGSFLAWIRFGVMSSKYLSTVVYKSGLLTSDEILAIIADKGDKTKGINKKRVGVFSRFWLAPRETIMPGYRLVTEKEVKMDNFIIRLNKNLKDNKGIKALKYMDMPGTEESNIFVGDCILRLDELNTFVNENVCIPNHVCCVSAGSCRASDVDTAELLIGENGPSAEDVCMFVRKNLIF